MTQILALGTAQFGLNYGLTNINGKIEYKEATKIMEIAYENGIRHLDTAQAYGDAEEMIGRILRDLGVEMNITTKISSIYNNIYEEDGYSREDIKRWESKLQKSLKNLKKENIEVLMVHSARDLTVKGNSYLKEWLHTVKERNIAKKIGVSIYEPKELRGIPEGLREVLQIPVSLYDQKLDESGFIKKEAVRSEIHARSIFLQGLIISKSTSWPEWIETKHKEEHKALEKTLRAEGESLIDIALSYIKEIEEIKKVVVGISSEKELVELVKSWRKPICREKKDLYKLGKNDSNLTDPRNWPS